MQMFSIFFPAIMLTQEFFLLAMWIPSITFLLKAFFSRAKILVWLKRNVCPVVYRWKGIPLSLFSSGWMPVKSPSQDHSCYLTLTFNGLLVWTMYWCTGSLHGIQQSKNILKSLRLKFSPRDVPKILWRIQVEVVSQGQIFLEQRPVISADSIWIQLFAQVLGDLNAV